MSQRLRHRIGFAKCSCSLKHDIMGSAG